MAAQQAKSTERLALNGMGFHTKHNQIGFDPQLERRSDRAHPNPLKRRNSLELKEDEEMQKDQYSFYMYQYKADDAKI